MNKKQNGSAILAGIAITAILVASSLIAGNQFTQQAHAQATSTPSTPSTPSTNTTSPRPAAGGQKVTEPRTGQTVNWQGTVASIPSPLPGRDEDVAVILPPRKDSGLYTGVITWTASKAVSAQVWNELSGVSATMPLNTKTFGKLAISPYTNGKLIATATVGSGDTSGSVPFAGNAVALVGKSPFIATYSVTAQATPGKVTNNLTSAQALPSGGTLGTLGASPGTAGPLTLGTGPSSGSSGPSGGAALGSSPAISSGGGSSGGGDDDTSG
jgi:hypothetical protein